MNEQKKAIQTPIAPGGVGWYSIGQEEIDAVTELLQHPQRLWRYHESSITNQLERELENKLGVKHALFVNSGTSALACCLAGLGIGPGDEVIIQAYTYIATASACLEVGAVPVVAEIDESLSLDPADVEKKITPYTRAVIMTHMQGVPGRIAAVREVARRRGIAIIEDCCQAIGSKYFGEYTGVGSDAFAWSLNYYKVITCGEGGFFFTNQDEASVRAYYQSDPAGSMWDTGIENRAPQVHVFTKACYRGNELCAAVAKVQVGKLDHILEQTRHLKKTLLSHLNEPIHYTRQHVDDPEGDCGISFALIVKDQAQCEPFARALDEEGLNIGSAYNASFPDRHIYCYWDSILDKVGGSKLNYPWNDPRYLGNATYGRDMCPNSLDILARSLRIPIHLAMTEQNMIEIADAINKADQRI